MTIVAVQRVWYRVSADYQAELQTRTRTIGPETTVGELMQWAKSPNVLGRGDVVLTETDDAAWQA